jgi:formyltetrahydrofolate-dependent phosphoribosylglycinamide formyltransferase
LQAVLNAVRAGQLAAQVVLVVSNRKDAFGLVRAADFGVPTLYLPLKPYTDAGKARIDYDRDLAVAVGAHRPDLIVLAGWLHVFSDAFLAAFPRRVINLHPALPGMFPGLDAIRRAFEAFGRGEIAASGCMMHYVVPEVDAGEVVVQAEVPILSSDTLESFTARMHDAEHQLILHGVERALQAVTQDRD